MTSLRSSWNRRELLGLLSAGVLAARPLTMQEQPAMPVFSALDHIEFYVANVEKSRDFLVRIFGNTLRNRNNKRYLKLGSAYMAFELPRASDEIKVDHTSVSIRGLDMPKLHAFLEQRGVVYQDYPSGRDTAVVDTDGVRLQLSPENGWSFLNPATFLEEKIALTEEPIFRPLGMDHVVLYVKEPEKSVAFYQKFLGEPVRINTRIWFQAGSSRIGLQQTPSGRPPGVYYFSLKAETFDSEAVTRRLLEIGVKIEAAEAPGTVRFRELNGYLIQVQ